MLQLDKTAPPAYDLPRGEGGLQRGSQHKVTAGRSQPRRRRAETFTLRDLRNLTLFSLVVGGYVWVHVAGAIKLFGRP